MVFFRNLGADYAEGGQLDGSACSDFKGATPIIRRWSPALFYP